MSGARRLDSVQRRGGLLPQPADRAGRDGHVRPPDGRPGNGDPAARRRVQHAMTIVARRRGAFAADVAFAIDVAERAGMVLMDRYERLERIHHKSARDVVTEADHLSEELILSAIRVHGPGDGVLAEESGEHTLASGAAPTAGQR